MKAIFVPLIAWLLATAAPAENGAFGGSGGPPPIVEPTPVPTTASVGTRSLGPRLFVSNEQYWEINRHAEEHGGVATAFIEGTWLQIQQFESGLFTNEQPARQLLIAP